MHQEHASDNNTGDRPDGLATAQPSQQSHGTPRPTYATAYHHAVIALLVATTSASMNAAGVTKFTRVELAVIGLIATTCGLLYIATLVLPMITAGCNYLTERLGGDAA